MNFRIRNYIDSDFESVREIFFSSSSKKKFVNEQERDEFASRWLDYYVTFEKNNFLIAEDGRQVLGYLSGCGDSAAALDFFSPRIPSYSIFQDLFKEFPAHLHINFSEAARGQGLGTLLLNAFCSSLASGVHVVTSPESRNRSFYQRNGFEIEVLRGHNNKQFLFMGRPA
jgi:hypothetical protein